MALVPFDKLDPADEWAAWKPSADYPWSAKWAAHLYRRIAFGPSRDDLREAASVGLDATIGKLFAVPAEPPRRDRIVNEPAPVSATTSLPDPTSQVVALRAEWVERMLSGVEPAREKLTLFWHNHFATSIRKVNDAGLMERQIDGLYNHALGSFRAMLKVVSRDPAMLVWLDSNDNVKSHPNENFAREVMELFTLGVGSYAEKDVQEAARAFTGWHTRDGKFNLVAGEHDGGPKTVLGKSGKWDGDDVLGILLAQPACAKFLVRKLYRFLVNEMATPPDAFLAPLADAFRKGDYDIAAAAKTIVRSRHFYSEYAYRRKVKSPVEYAVGVVRMVGVGATGRIVMNPYTLLGGLELMGQHLYAPPNVKGWEGGPAWLNTATVLARHNFAHSLVNGAGDLNDYAKKYSPRNFYTPANPLALISRQGITDPAKIVDYFANLLLTGDVRPAARDKLVAFIGDANPETETFKQRCRDVIFALLTLPEYQLN